MKERPITKTIAKKVWSEKAIAGSFDLAIQKAIKTRTSLIVQRNKKVEQISPAAAARLSARHK